jgi:hypothetical protein
MVFTSMFPGARSEFSDSEALLRSADRTGGSGVNQAIVHNQPFLSVPVALR